MREKKKEYAEQPQQAIHLRCMKNRQNQQAPCIPVVCRIMSLCTMYGTSLFEMEKKKLMTRFQKILAYNLSTQTCQTHHGTRIQRLAANCADWLEIRILKPLQIRANLGGCNMRALAATSGPYVCLFLLTDTSGMVTNCTLFTHILAVLKAKQIRHLSTLA